MVKEAVFEELWCSAMEHVVRIGHEDGLSMMEGVVEQFEEETGQIATAEMVSWAVAAASTLWDGHSTGSLEAESESEDEDEEEVAIEMALAMDTVRELGALHAEQLVNDVIDLIVDEEGEEPSLEELYSIFDDVQDGLAEEEAEDHDHSGECDHDSFAAEWESAMDHIKMVALHDQEALLDALCDSFYDQHGAEPSTPELYEIFAEIKASFAEEAVEDLIETELEAIERAMDRQQDDDDDDDDSDYSPDSDAFHYSLDALDDVLFHDSEYDDADSSDSDYVADDDQEALQSTYALDRDDDVASSEDDGGDQIDGDQQEAAELSEDSESLYSPDSDPADYYADYEADHFYSAPSDYDHDLDDGSASGSGSDSDSQQTDVSYNPGFDLFDYSFDHEPFEGHSDDQYSDDSTYSEGKDRYDYDQDLEDDFASSDSISGSEEDGQELEEREEAA